MQDADFAHALEVFRQEAEAGTQFLSAYLAVHRAAGDYRSVHRLLNEAPLFWNTNLGALQTSMFITLGRIFDPKAKHSVHKLLNSARNNQHLFSKQALGRRKQRTASNASEWLSSYLLDVHVPTVADFRALGKQVDKWRRVYEKNYRNLRHRYFAHREVSESEEIAALFAKTTIIELQELFAFLSALHNALQQLFLNGRVPAIQPSAGGRGETPHERITSEAKRFLLAAASAREPSKRRKRA
jgi:AbiU2